MESKNVWNHEFNLNIRSLSELVLQKAKDKGVFIWEKNKVGEKSYSKFVLEENKQFRYIMELKLPQSPSSAKISPKIIFRREQIRKPQDDTEDNSGIDDHFQISFDERAREKNFWLMIDFLYNYREILDIDNFSSKFTIAPTGRTKVFENEDQLKEKELLLAQIEELGLSSSALKPYLRKTRKTDLQVFFLLLRDEQNYREKYKKTHNIIQDGEEYIWHHFLKERDWILGLNSNMAFAIDLLAEKLIGTTNSDGKMNPKVDFLGINEYVTIIELKTCTVQFFKKKKSKGRTNTWDFTVEFIEAVSQCLGQKHEFDSSWEHTELIGNDDCVVDKKKILGVDPLTILVFGNKKMELPQDSRDQKILVQRKTFQRFRRNLRNVEIITYDELFERAYYAIFERKLETEWWNTLQRTDLK